MKFSAGVRSVISLRRGLGGGAAKRTARHVGQVFLFSNQVSRHGLPKTCWQVGTLMRTTAFTKVFKADTAGVWLNYAALPELLASRKC